MKSKARVVWWSNMPTPYFVERFNAIADRGNLDFEAWFNVEREADRAWTVDPGEWRFRARYIPEWSLFGWRQHLPLAELRDARPDLFVQEYHWVNLAMAAFPARAAASRIALRVLPNFDAWSQRTWWREASKHILFRTVDGAKVPGADGAELAQNYGLPASRVSRVRQSINVGHYGRALSYDLSKRAHRRQELGLHGCVFIYVGRLWRGKGLDHLLSAYRSVCKHEPDVSLLLVGNGVDAEELRRASADLPGVRFTGFVQQDELPDYYAISDVMVFPTLGDPNGLVVEEAMAAGLPVISTEAAGDIRRRVVEGVTGFVVRVGNSEELGDRMLTLARDPRIRRRFAEAAVRAVANKTHEQYAIDFENFAEAVMSRPSRHTLTARTAWVLGWLLLMCDTRKGHPAPYLAKQVLRD